MRYDDKPDHNDWSEVEEQEAAQWFTDNVDIRDEGENMNGSTDDGAFDRHQLEYEGRAHLESFPPDGEEMNLWEDELFHSGYDTDDDF